MWAVVQKRLNVILDFPILDINDQVIILASRIPQAGIIPQKAVTGAAHIAIAAVHQMQFLMTWNCTHIANAELIDSIRRVCLDHGFSCPIICTPEELMGE